jgi:DNA-binding response OmpR family regulator
VNSQPSNTTLVIADDEAPIRMVVGERLRSAGFTVLEARDGEEALDLIRQHLPVAVITDLQMPYMNGLELCTALRAESSTASIPVLLLTARGHVLSDDAISRTSIKRIMSKPFGVRELLAYVQETLVPAGTTAAQSAAGRAASPAPIREAA